MTDAGRRLCADLALMLLFGAGVGLMVAAWFWR